MHKTNKQEEFSRAYMCALAAPLGYNLGDFRVDNDSIDIMFKAIYDRSSKRRNPHIDFQLKCTLNSFSDDGYLHYPIKMKNYNDLRGDNRANPSYLVVICVPENEDDWVEVRAEEMLLRYSAYWISLKDAPTVKNEKNITIKISKQQKFDQNTFKMLMDKASEGIAL
jgi:hypothetical protein